MATLESWILGAMLSISPPDKIAPIKNTETVDEMKVRYADIAKDLAEVIDASTPLYKGADAKEKTASIMLATGKYESGDWDKRVDDGTRRGDGGASWCLMQIHLGDRNVYFGTDEMKTWKGKDLISDRKKCFTAGMEVLRMSLRACGHLKGGGSLSLYRFNTCREKDGNLTGRWNLAQYILRTNKKDEPKKDEPEKRAGDVPVLTVAKKDD